MRFAHMKRILRLDRLRLRGLNGVRDEVLLTATAQNLRRLAKLICRPRHNWQSRAEIRRKTETADTPYQKPPKLQSQARPQVRNEFCNTIRPTSDVTAHVRIRFMHAMFSA